MFCTIYTTEDKEHEKATKVEARGNEQEVPAKRNDDVGNLAFIT